MELKTHTQVEAKRAAIVREMQQHVIDAQTAKTFEEALHLLALRARLAIGAHQCAISYVPNGNFRVAIHTHSFSEKYEKYNTYDVVPTGQGIWALVVQGKKAVRMTQPELVAHPMWKNFSDLKDRRGVEHPPMRGWLAAPVLRQTGDVLGVIQLSDKCDDAEFTAKDLDLLIHLATMVLPTFELQYVNQRLQERTRELQAQRRAALNLAQDAEEARQRAEQNYRAALEANDALQREIGERQRAEERLRLAQQAAHIGAFEWDTQTGVNTWTPELEAMYGLPRGGFSRTQPAWEDLVHPDDRAQAVASVEQAFETGAPTEGEWRVVWPDGSVHWLVGRYQVFKNEFGQPLRLTGVNIDISERKRAEEEIRKLNAELEQRVSERTAQLEAANKELEAFSYSVSHDLRAPLRAIDGFSRILLQKYAAVVPDEARDHLQEVRDSTRQMGRLVDDLLAFSRLGRQSLRKQAVAPERLVRQCLDELRGDREGRQVEITVGELPVCQADPALLKQVWANLLANALKYTGRRDVARIEIGCRPEPLVNGCRAATVYFVTDNGVGFDMRYADKLFSVFQRLHRAEDYEGTGVGLAIVQRIVHRHGGRVWAEAQPDRGATFSFTLEGGNLHG